MDKIQRMKELIEVLEPAGKAYYTSGVELIDNFTWDKLTDELAALEEETGVVLKGSPSVRVGYDPLSSLPKEEHPKPMLSLDKTKEVSVLQEKAGDKDVFISWKMDGLTVVLTYENGELVKGVTRGNGKIGEVITQNARLMRGVATKIPEKDRKVIRGEAVITYSSFNKTNETLPDGQLPYKNPRNLCAGTIRNLNPKLVEEREVTFFAFEYVEGSKTNSHSEALKSLERMGINTVAGVLVKADGIPAAVKEFSEQVKTNDFPSDGLVLVYDDIAYGESLGSTGKFPRKGLAFKWRDEEAETTVRSIDWSVSRTSLINPVVCFDTVDLEGTDVSRASIHNVSMLKQFKIGIGDKVKVLKANMIIPQISENMTKSGPVDIPKVCPVCGAPTELRIDPESGCETLYCTGTNCVAAETTKIAHYCERDAMNIIGISEKTITTLFTAGLLHTISDIYNLESARETIVEMDGFGARKFEKMVEAINNTKHTEPARFLYAIGVPGFGVSSCELLCKNIKVASVMDFAKVTTQDMDGIDGIGEKMMSDYAVFFSNEQNLEELKKLSEYVTIKESSNTAGDDKYDGMTFVITGSLEKMSRKELTEAIKSHGGKVSGSVSAKTTALVNNDVNSSSSKNKDAKKLGIRIMSEQEFYDEYQP